MATLNQIGRYTTCPLRGRADILILVSVPLVHCEVESICNTLPGTVLCLSHSTVLRRYYYYLSGPFLTANFSRLFWNHLEVMPRPPLEELITLSKGTSGAPQQGSRENVECHPWGSSEKKRC